MQGFLLPDFADRYVEGLEALSGSLNDGSLRAAEDILEGLEAAPEALVGLLRGANIGKRLVHVADPVA